MIGNDIHALAQNLWKINRSITGEGNRKTLKITIELPSPKQIFSVTPMPWATGLSWAQRIELGMSGYPNYIAREKKGRSGGGIQAEESLFTGKFRNVKYISHFINTWEKKFLKIFK